MRARRLCLGVGVMLWLCTSALLGCGTHTITSAPVTMPHDAGLRRSSLQALGQSLFEGLRAGTLAPTFATQRELDAMLVPEARLRLDRERASSTTRGFRLEVFRSEWGAARFAGFCVQGARDEGRNAGLGLLEPGWVLDRFLVAVSVGDTGLRSAAWVEGDFVYTGEGWRALSLRRVEAPRRHHADLDLAPCDVEAGLR